MQKSRMFFHKEFQEVLSVEDKRSALANADSQSAAAKQIWIEPSMPAQPRFALLAFAQSRDHHGNEGLTVGKGSRKWGPEDLGKAVMKDKRILIAAHTKEQACRDPAWN